MFRSRSLVNQIPLRFKFIFYLFFYVYNEIIELMSQLKQ